MSEQDRGQAQERGEDVPCDRYIVGIGASAGGLEALEKFFQAVPDKPGVTFVIIQHLSPDYESHMEQLLSRRTRLPIHRVTHEMKLEEECVYLIPPAKTLIISEGKFLLTPKDSKSVTYPIDTFLRSLAAEVQKSAIGVILSGTGSDGSQGIQAIREAGGLVIAQDEDSAGFTGMPASAVQTGAVNLILNPEEMPSAIIKYTQANLSPDQLEKNPPVPIPATALEEIFSELERTFGIDFDLYKPNTILRRLQRRIETNNDPDIESYAERLRNSEEEVHALYRDLLIDVTHFFRDPDAFKKLNQEVITKIVAEEEDQVRVWVPGCATGEEAYTLAILFIEAFEALGKRVYMKIFASDAHSDSIRRASEAVYDEHSVKNLSPERLERFFVENKGSYRIKPEVRRLVVFTQHNIIKDVPFTRINLITCRNLLIYFQQAAQRKVLAYFHFSLRSSGRLMLGPSETLGDLDSEFTIVDKHWKIYQKLRNSRVKHDLILNPDKTAPTVQTTQYIQKPKAVPEIAPSLSRDRSNGIDPAFYDDILDGFLPPSVLVSSAYEVLHVFSGGEKYLSLKRGRTSQSLGDLVREDIRAAVTSAFQHSLRDGKKVSYQGISQEGEGEVLSISVRPVSGSHQNSKAFLISFLVGESEISVISKMQEKLTNEGDLVLDQNRELELQLGYAKENLQATVEELETSNEELQATNEELVASNEELQSSNEELHSVNEELDTMNDEYQGKIRELTELTADIDNMLSATDIGILFLDEDLRIRKFTPQIADVFDIIQKDVGRPLMSFSGPIDAKELEKDLREVLESGEELEKEIILADGQRFLVRIAPYVFCEMQQGIILSVVEITSMREVERRAKELAEIVASSNDAIIGFTFSGQITNWNRGAETLYGYSRVEAEGKNALDLIVPAGSAALFMNELEKARKGEGSTTINMPRRTKMGHEVMVAFRLSTAANNGSSETQVSSIERDITSDLLVRHDRDRLAEVLENATDFVGICDAEFKMLYINRGGREMIGFGEEEDLSSYHISKVHPEESWKHMQEVIMPAVQAEGSWSGRNTLIGRDGTSFPVAQKILKQEGREGHQHYYSTIIRDLTKEEQTYDQLRKVNHKSREIANTLRRVISNFPEMVVVLDKERNVQFCSPDAEAFIESHGHGGQLPLGLDELLDEVYTTKRSYLPVGATGVAMQELHSGAIRYYLRRVATLLDASENFAGAIITLQDVTEFRMLEQVKGDLIGAVSHELKNPVAAISMALGLSLDGALGEMTELQRKTFEGAADECDRISQTIDSLLNLTRFEAADGELDAGSTTVDQFVQESIEANRLYASRNEISLDYKTEIGDLSFRCDKDRLLIALNNFVSNAIKHSEKGDVVVIEAFKYDDRLKITVWDNGPGVPDDLREKIFTKFYKVPSNAKPGSGLGLNIAKEFVEAHAGEVGIEHREKGAGFFFTIPIES